MTVCRAAILFVVSLLCSVAVAADAPADDFRQRMRPCEACHGREGRPAADGYYPRIAGKPAGYLFEQLLNFRDGRRILPMMIYMVERQDESYLRQMAEYFSQLEYPYPPPAPVNRNAASMKQGADLARRGDPVRNIPACMACHGERLTGAAPAVPGLLGLPHYYLAAQLNAWRQGLRHARAPDCMAEIAQRLSPEDVDAVSAWLASQPVPSNARAPVLHLEPPLKCGSLEPRR
jgi:cytochrome c553